jgi:uncharacterized protein (TIGR02145 family)
MKKIHLIFLSVIILIAVSSCKKDDNNDNNNNNPLPDPDPVTDIDGNVYQTVRIGNQIWMAENLRVTRYSNGDSITNGTASVIWKLATTGAYCYYNDSMHYINKYGLLYNWYVGTDSRKLCPAGWHFPSYEEFTTLMNTVGGPISGGKKLRATKYWNETDTLTNNSSGFSAVPGGYRDQLGAYHNQRSRAFLWTTNEAPDEKGWYYRINTGTSETIIGGNVFKNYGHSCRCVKD